jgi:hypothetical protein
MNRTLRSSWILGLTAIGIGAAALVLSGLAFPLVGLVCDRTGCVRASTRRIHDENMAKAEAFRGTFDNDVKPGSSFDDVLAYLKAHNLHFGLIGLTAPQDEPPRGDGREEREVEMFREESPNWYCGKGSVGLGIYFVNGKLDRTEAGYWSSDCP